MRNYIYLLQVYGAGNPWIHNAIKFYGSAKNAVKKLMEGDRSVISSKRIPAIAAASLENSDKIINSCTEKGIKIITIDDADYPTLLKNIYNPPTVLFVQGDISGLDKRLCLAAVGPRTPDRYAAKLASVICPGLAEYGIVLISGLARGIDQAAHIAAIRAHQPTVAVLACGIDVEYPANTARLRHDIAAEGGAIISELLPGTSCRAGYFKYRNRIISGLANGTLVIGANDTSGSMITARHAAEQDRDLFFTVPPDTLSENVKSIIKYLRDGAVPVYDHYDIISEYYDIYGDRLNTATDENSSEYTAHDGNVSSESPDEQEEKPRSSGSVDYLDIMPKKYRILLGYENPDGTLTEQGRSFQKNKKAAAKASEEPPADPEAPEEPPTIPETPEEPPVKPEMPEEPPTKPEVPKESPVKPEVPEKADAEIPAPVTDGLSSIQTDIDPESLRGRITLLLKESDGGISLDEILKSINDDFGDVTETLADMEIDGLITCTAGNVYILNE